MNILAMTRYSHFFFHLFYDCEVKQTIADNYDGKFIETEKCNAIYSYKKMPVCVRPKL